MSAAPKSPFPFAIWPDNDLHKSRKPNPAARVGSYAEAARKFGTPHVVTQRYYDNPSADGHPFDEEDHLLDMTHESDQAEHAQSLSREERERRYGDARYTGRTRSPVEAKDDLPRQSSMRRTKKAYDPKRHASQESFDRYIDSIVESDGGADPKPKKPKADKPAKPDWKVQGQQRILQSPRSKPRQDNSSHALRTRNSPDAMEKGIGDVMSRAANYLKQKVSGAKPEKPETQDQRNDRAYRAEAEEENRNRLVNSKTNRETHRFGNAGRGATNWRVPNKVDETSTRYFSDRPEYEARVEVPRPKGSYGHGDVPIYRKEMRLKPGAYQTNDKEADYYANIRNTRIRNDQLRGKARGETGEIDSAVRIKPVVKYDQLHSTDPEYPGSVTMVSPNTTYQNTDYSNSEQHKQRSGGYRKDVAARGQSGGGARSGMAPALGVGEDINEPKNMMNRSMRRGTMRKSVPMGYSFDNPMPIPFHDDGLPNWDGVPHGCFASLPMDNGPLKGKVVVLHRLQNGMYIISPDGKLSNPQNRDKDKGKLRKERPEVATDDNYGTEMAEKSLRRMRKGFSEKLRDEFLILAGYKPQQLRVVKKAAPQPGKQTWRNRQGRPMLQGQSGRVRASDYVDTGMANNGLRPPEMTEAEQTTMMRAIHARERIRNTKKQATIKPYVEAMGYNPNDVYKHMAGSHHIERVDLERKHADAPSATVQPKRDALAIKHQNITRELIARIRKDHAKFFGQEPMPKELRPIAGLSRLHPEQFKAGTDFFSRPADSPWDVPRNVPRPYIPDSEKRAE